MTKTPTLSRRLSGMAVALLLGVACAVAARAGTWDDAQAAFSDFDDGVGLRLLERAAQEGDARAMLAWGLALKHRQRLFPGWLQADAGQAGPWFDKLARHCALQQARPGEGGCWPVTLSRPRSPFPSTAQAR